MYWILFLVLVSLSASAEREASVATELDLFRALGDPGISIIRMAKDIQLTSSVDVPGATGGVYELTRNCTITAPATAPTDWYPTLDFNYCGAKIKLPRGVWLFTQHLFIQRLSPQLGVFEVSFIDRSSTGSFVSTDTTQLQEACYGLSTSVAQFNMSSARPASVPGTQSARLQPGGWCSPPPPPPVAANGASANVTTKTCWPATIYLADSAFNTSYWDLRLRSAVVNTYIAQRINSTFICEKMIDAACTTQYGGILQCWNALLTQSVEASNPRPSAPSPGAQVGSSSSSSSFPAWAIGVIVAGAVLMAVALAVTAVLVVRRWRMWPELPVKDDAVFGSSLDQLPHSSGGGCGGVGGGSGDATRVLIPHQQQVDHQQRSKRDGLVGAVDRLREFSRGHGMSKLVGIRGALSVGRSREQGQREEGDPEDGGGCGDVEEGGAGRRHGRETATGKARRRSAAERCGSGKDMDEWCGGGGAEERRSPKPLPSLLATSSIDSAASPHAVLSLHGRGGSGAASTRGSSAKAASGVPTADSFDASTSCNMFDECDSSLGPMGRLSAPSRIRPRDLIHEMAAKSAMMRDEHVELGKVLGRGGGGVVYQGLWKGLPVAAKVMIVNEEQHDQSRRQILEATMSTSLSHPNIVITYNYDLRRLGASPSADERLVLDELGGACVTAWQLIMLQELCRGGALRQAIEVKPNASAGGRAVQPLCLEHVFLLAHDVSAGLEHLHSKNVVHSDLTANNVLLQTAIVPRPAGLLWVAKVADFGLSNTIEDGHSQVSKIFNGTPHYLAPETQKSGIVSKCSDVFSFGILLYEMIVGSPVPPPLPRPALPAALAHARCLANPTLTLRCRSMYERASAALSQHQMMHAPMETARSIADSVASIVRIGGVSIASLTDSAAALRSLTDSTLASLTDAPSASSSLAAFSAADTPLPLLQQRGGYELASATAAAATRPPSILCGRSGSATATAAVAAAVPVPLMRGDSAAVVPLTRGGKGYRSACNFASAVLEVAEEQQQQQEASLLPAPAFVPTAPLVVSSTSYRPLVTALSVPPNVLFGGGRGHLGSGLALPPLPAHVPPEYVSLVEACLSPLPQNRPTIAAVRQSLYLMVEQYVT